MVAAAGGEDDDSILHTDHSINYAVIFNERLTDEEAIYFSTNPKAVLNIIETNTRSRIIPGKGFVVGFTEAVVPGIGYTSGKAPIENNDGYTVPGVGYVEINGEANNVGSGYTLAVPKIVKYAIRTDAGWDGMTALEQLEYAGYFDLLSDWETNIPDDLVELNQQWIAECFNDWASGLNDIIDISGRTTSEVNNITVTSPEGERHNGIPESGFFLTYTPNYTNILTASSLYTIIEYIEAIHLGNGGSFDVKNTVILRNCLGKCLGASGSRPVFLYYSMAILINCLAYDSERGYGTDVSHISSNFFNCMAVNCSVYGFHLHGTTSFPIKINNCLTYNCAIDYSSLNAIDVSSSNNATSKSTIDPDLGTITDVVDADFVDAPNDNYHLSNTSQLRGEGLNLITEGYLSSPQFDIDGEQWPDSGVWDIGFDYNDNPVTPVDFNPAWAQKINTLIGGGL